MHKESTDHTQLGICARPHLIVKIPATNCSKYAHPARDNYPLCAISTSQLPCQIAFNFARPSALGGGTSTVALISLSATIQSPVSVLAVIEYTEVTT